MVRRSICLLMFKMTSTPVNYSENLLQNVHEGTEPPTTNGTTSVIQGSYHYYHYGCDGMNDKGWGCGYRTLQTICSWIRGTIEHSPAVPSIPAIQQILIHLEDKPSGFMGSHDWIGSFEVCLVVDHLYGVSSKIIHVTKGSDLNQHMPSLIEHFNRYGSPLMMGGDQDCSAKAVMGIHASDSDVYLLIVDPHYCGRARSCQELQKKEWVKWQHIDEFVHSSFYNICLPLCTGNGNISGDKNNAVIKVKKINRTKKI
ncbi:ufm1-specific protease 1 isoform X3 [Cryptotermes secundus]|uniref:ufm1-specific protease 1 isoform X3 n=1 Tax=Cryptotermes secundus TaxID=105785 RepID=UPI000CD7DF47|nr:ufm1-specific protease 1 isoform X3 [Cryptotermes secundus]